ncbi:MAG: ribosome-associated translation inhibitor RaiA [Tepidisphaeraceae bacterium]|jgi:ribosomal subunit interface protein
MMQPNIVGTNIPLSDSIRNHIEDRLSPVIERFKSRITSVSVRFGDCNGHKGGVDKQCRMEAVVGHAGSIVAEETHADLYAAIDVAAERLMRAISHKVERRQEARRS